MNQAKEIYQKINNLSQQLVGRLEDYNQAMKVVKDKAINDYLYHPTIRNLQKRNDVLEALCQIEEEADRNQSKRINANIIREEREKENNE